MLHRLVLARRPRCRSDRAHHVIKPTDTICYQDALPAMDEVEVRERWKKRVFKGDSRRVVVGSGIQHAMQALH